MKPENNIVCEEIPEEDHRNPGLGDIDAKLARLRSQGKELEMHHYDFR